MFRLFNSWTEINSLNVGEVRCQQRFETQVLLTPMLVGQTQQYKEFYDITYAKLLSKNN